MHSPPLCSMFPSKILQNSFPDIYMTQATPVIRYDKFSFLFFSLIISLRLIISIYALPQPSSANGRSRRHTRHVFRANLSVQRTTTREGKHTVSFSTSMVIHNEGGPKQRSKSSISFLSFGIAVQKDSNDLLIKGTPHSFYSILQAAPFFIQTICIYPINAATNALQLDPCDNCCE